MQLVSYVCKELYHKYYTASTHSRILDAHVV